MFFTIDDIISKDQWTVNAMWITSLKDGDDKKSDPNYELLIFQGDGGRPLIESFASSDDRDSRRNEIISKGNFFILEDIYYNIVWVQSISKIESGDPLSDGNLAQNPLCRIAFANGRVLYGQFDSESDRDNFYNLLLSLSIGGGGGSAPIITGGQLVQKPTKNDFPTTGDTKNTYIAKNENAMYYWDSAKREYVLLSSGGSGGDAVLTEQIVSNVTVGAANAGSVFKKDMSFTDFAKKILTKDVAPSITAATFKDKGTNNAVGIREKGVTVSGVDFAVTISAGTMDRSKLKEVNFYVGSTKVKTIAINTNNNYSFSYTGNITNNTTVKAELVYDGTKTSTKSATYEFIYARFFGKTSVDLDSSNISTFLTSATKTVVKGNGYTGTIDLNDERFVYAYPASYADLKSIKDGNGFEQIDGYTPQIITISYPTNSDSVQYKVYTLDDPATGTGFKQIYS